MAHQPYSLSLHGFACRATNKPIMTALPSSFTKEYTHRVPSTSATVTSLCESDPKEKLNVKSLDSTPYTHNFSLLEEGSNTYKVHGMVTRPVKSCDKKNTHLMYNSNFSPDTKGRRKDGLKGTPQPNPLVNTKAEEDGVGVYPINNEPTEYVGRGLLPSSSFIFLAEAPPPRTGRQTRLDYRAIFAMSKRENQASRYGVNISDIDKPQHHVAGVPDWSEFSGAGKKNGGKRKYREMRRTSGGRVRAWVE